MKDWQDEIRPLPPKFGVGFTSPELIPSLSESKYRYEQVGRYHNYHFTTDKTNWPSHTYYRMGLTIDGFSPNLNKTLHIGHLRNLAVATSLQEILDCRFVAMLGASLGVKKAALDGWEWWTEFVGYTPRIYYDVALPDDVVPCHRSRFGDPEGLEPCPMVWDGPKGPVIVKRSDGTPVYAFHDLAFAAEVGPTHYITGHEQREHFDSLGLGDRHLPMGLVLGDDGKKIKSRTGDALSATEALQIVSDKLDDTPDRKKLAWNILAWNFLNPARETNVKFELDRWTDPNAPGLYITYTYARIASVLREDWYHPPEKDIDVTLLGYASYYDYYWKKAADNLDPSPLAVYALELAKVMNTAYATEKIVDGRLGFRYALYSALMALSETMRQLSMFRLNKI